MEDIIGKIFELEFSEKAFLFETTDKEGIRKEWGLYEKLLDTLTREEKSILTEYISLRQAREREEIKNSYKNGFAAAIKLWEESLKR